MVVQITDHDHFDKIMEEAGAGLVVVDFFATWSCPCKAIPPFIEQLSEKFKDKVTFIKVDVDECEDIAQEYNISCMPTFLFLKNKAKVGEFSGAKPVKLEEMVVKHARTIPQGIHYQEKRYRRTPCSGESTLSKQAQTPSLNATTSKADEEATVPKRPEKSSVSKMAKRPNVRKKIYDPSSYRDDDSEPMVRLRGQAAEPQRKRKGSPKSKPQLRYQIFKRSWDIDTDDEEKRKRKQKPDTKRIDPSFVTGRTRGYSLTSSVRTQISNVTMDTAENFSIPSDGSPDHGDDPNATPQISNKIKKLKEQRDRLIKYSNNYIQSTKRAHIESLSRRFKQLKDETDADRKNILKERFKALQLACRTMFGDTENTAEEELWFDIKLASKL